MKIINRKELYEYLNNINWNNKKDTELSSVYFLVTYNKRIQPIYFMKYDNVYFESNCSLFRCLMSEDELEDYVREIYEEKSFHNALEYERTMQRGKWHYEISCPQCSPFLPEQLENIEMISESECLDFLMKHYNW